MGVSNGLDTDQDRRFVGPDPCQNCLPVLSADGRLHVYFNICKMQDCDVFFLLECKKRKSRSHG